MIYQIRLSKFSHPEQTEGQHTNGPSNVFLRVENGPWLIVDGFRSVSKVEATIKKTWFRFICQTTLPTTKGPSMSDAIKKPAHYNQGPIECIDAMKIVLTPEEFRGYLKGNVFKYLWREKDKNGIEDLRKAKWYLDRLIDSFGEGEQKQTAWIPKIGDSVRIKKPSSDKRDSVLWSSFMDGHDKEVVQVKEIKDGAMVHGEWFFPFDWLEPAEQPVIKQSVTTEPPDGWRWLEVGEIIRKGDANYAIKPVPEHWVGTQCIVTHVALRRNKFEVGEKVVAKDNHEIWEVDSLVNGIYQLKNGQVFYASFPEHLAPYMEEQS